MRILATNETTPLLASELSIDRPTASPQVSGDGSFENVFVQMVQQTNQAAGNANRKVEDLAKGASDDLHGTMIAVKEADISIRLVGTIRNKLLDAFTEIWKTSV